MGVHPRGEGLRNKDVLSVKDYLLLRVSLSLGEACSDYYFKKKEHPRHLEAGSNGGTHAHQSWG